VNRPYGSAEHLGAFAHKTKSADDLPRNAPNRREEAGLFARKSKQKVQKASIAICCIVFPKMDAFLTEGKSVCGKS
jgi:hypothetical protein